MFLVSLAVVLKAIHVSSILLFLTLFVQSYSCVFTQPNTHHHACIIRLQKRKSRLKNSETEKTLSCWGFYVERWKNFKINWHNKIITNTILHITVTEVVCPKNWIWGSEHIYSPPFIWVKEFISSKFFNILQGQQLTNIYLSPHQTEQLLEFTTI